MGGVLDIKWAHNGIVTTGHYCTAQGIIKQVGELGVALIALVRLLSYRLWGLRTYWCASHQLLAVHTFVAALWRVGLQARSVALGLVCPACLFITLWVGIGASVHKNYETPTPVSYSTLSFPTPFSHRHYSSQYWCWISPQFPGERLGGEYIYLWLALFASAILYIPLYFWAEGRLSIDEECWYRFQMSNADQRVEYAPRRAALGMLL
jgi:hypothetical protein